jgi:UDP-glucose 4-epimerase
VRLLDDFSSGREANLAHLDGSAELLRGDLRERALLERALRGVEVVFHQAAVPSVPRSVAEPERTHSVNVTGTLGLLEASRAAGVRRVVFASSSSAYGDTPVLPKVETLPPCPLSPYALQKYAAERYCQLYHRLYGLETVALRYFNVYGPRQDPESEYAAVIPRFARACLADAPAVVFGDGEQTRDFTFVDDAVAANLLAADAPRAAGEVVNVAGGRRVSLNALLAELRALTGARTPPRHEPARPGDVRDSLADLGRARELLGFVPRVDLPIGLARTLEFLKQGALRP